MSVITRLSCILVFISFSSLAQITDTLQYAREKAYAQDFFEANRILSVYNRNKSDVYGLWLQAQVASWMGDIQRSKDLYSRARSLSPEHAGLELDYGRSLFNSGDIKASETFLEAYLQKDPGNPDAMIMLAYIDYWNGRTKTAENTARQVVAMHPEHELGLQLLEEIKVATAPYITVASSFRSDDQPLEMKEYVGAAGKYHSRYLSPFVKAGYRDFILPNTNVQSLFFEAGNTMSLGISGPVVSFSAGIFKPDNNIDLTEVTGRVGITQKLSKNIAVELNTARIPYQFTLASLEEPLMQQVSSIALSLNDPESIVGKAAYERQTFPDENSIHTAYAYVLKSLFNSGVFRFDIGYSFSYAHSNLNTFRLNEPIIVRPGLNMYTQMSGIYDPYFSPQNQMVNAALGSLRIVPSEVFEIKLRTSYGVYAQADNPVLMASAGQGNSTRVDTFFYVHTYTPVEMFAEITAKISRQFHVKAEYQYSKLFFYELHRLGLSANYSFL